MSDIQTISTIAAEMSKTVAEACAAMTAAAEQFKAADTQPPPDVFESILARLEKLESAVEAIDMTVEKIDYDALSDYIDMSDLADYVASNIDPSNIAEHIEVDDVLRKFIENVVRDVLRSV
jgi:argininosuccinate lyase